MIFYSPSGDLMTFSAPHTILITGIMASGKSTIAQALAERLPKSVHLRGDLFRRMIVNDQASMDPDKGEALTQNAEEQLRLRYRIAASVATLYVQAGFTVVYQDIIIGPMLNDLVTMLPAPLSVVVLCPAPDVAGQRDQTRHKTGYGDGGWTPQQLDDDLRHNTPRLGLWLDNSTLSIEETVSAILARADEALVRS
jgi:chloramphenicol 3-O-phosphotransferase